MKKLFLYSALAAISMTAASCQEEIHEKLNTDDDIVFTATIDCVMDTKTSLTSDRKVKWEAGDEISINGMTYIATPKMDATEADFKKKGIGTYRTDSGYYAFYPSYIQDEIICKGTLLAVQRYSEGRITNIPMFAHSMTTSLSFKNICAVLAVTVKRADFPFVKSIRVSSSNCAMSGKFSIADGQIAVLEDTANVNNTVTLDCGNAVATAIGGTVFRIAIPAQTYRNLKIELSAYGIDYTKSMTTKKDADIAVAVNTIYPVSFMAEADSSTTGTAKAMIDGSEVDVEWVQLWYGGPKFAVKNVGAGSRRDKGLAMSYLDATRTGSDYIWGSNWRTPSKDEMEPLLNPDKVSCTYCQEGDVWGFRFSSMETGYTGNYIFFPVEDSNQYTGHASYCSSTADEAGDARCLLLSFLMGEYFCDWYTDKPSEKFYVRPVLYYEWDSSISRMNWGEDNGDNWQ